MKRLLRTVLIVEFCLIILQFPSECDGHGDEHPAPVIISGSWYGVRLQGAVTGTMVLQQTGHSVAGTFVPRLGRNGTVSGQVKENIIDLVLWHSSGLSALNASVSGNRMSGSFKARNGESGTFTATRR
jgi:hypothetical protein